MSELIGTTPESVPRIDERYEIESFIGSGSYAWVFLARHATLQNRQFAVKVLRPEHAGDHTKINRFMREAELAAALTSPYTVDVVDYGETEDGAPYIVMDYVKGPDLGAVLDHYSVLDERIVARLSLNVLSALDEAHGYGIVHRDLKPENIFIVNVAGSEHPIARVGDFGIAKVISESSPMSSRATQTAFGTVLCTPAYAAPELLKGEVSIQADIYALGHVMAEMLDGEPPYREPHPVQVGARQLDDDKVPLGRRSSKSTLQPVITKALEKHPGHRYATAREMKADLEALMRDDKFLSSDKKPLDISSVRRKQYGDLEYEEGLSSATRTDAHIFGDAEDFRSTDELSLKMGPAGASGRREVTITKAERNRQSSLIWAVVVLLTLLIGAGVLWFSRDRGVAGEKLARSTVEPEPTFTVTDPVPSPQVGIAWEMPITLSEVQQPGFAPPAAKTAVQNGRIGLRTAIHTAHTSSFSATPIVPWVDFVVRKRATRNRIKN